MAYLIKTELANGETREIFFCDYESADRLVTAEMAQDWAKLTLFDDDEVELFSMVIREFAQTAPLTALSKAEGK